MAYDASEQTIAAVSFRRDERFAVLIGGAAIGVAAGFGAALALGRTGSWPIFIAAPIFLAAAYLAVATFRDALDRRAVGCSIAAALVVLTLLAWPAAGMFFPMTAPQFWIAPAATMGSMLLLASCWSGDQLATYRLSGEAASICAIIGFLGANTLMG
ncbi:MAG: hypothetical protein KF779_18305 [Hyphomonadaceae bacterium]|nr:hypothetical protein [Hyphomonadaceae bacterium]MCA8885534.1 hypothetical protein [Hyphomonadaceae bacterium]